MISTRWGTRGRVVWLGDELYSGPAIEGSRGRERADQKGAAARSFLTEMR